MKKNKIVIIGLIVLLLACGIWYFIPSAPTKSYLEFDTLVKESAVEKVSVSENNLTVTLKDGTKFKTTNPQSPDFSERLLLSGIEVKTEEDAAGILSLIFDVIFYLFFFGIIFIAFRKFISPNTFKIVRKTGVKFDDICGMENLKKNMLTIAQVMKNPAAAKKQGIRAPKGILLAGAPGNGKTLFARALAQESGVNFIAAKATDFESMFMAIGPMKVKLLFSKARKHKPCMIFIDEFDGIGTRRNYSGSAIETENTRIVTALLNELDGFVQNDGIMVIAATNSIDALDPALIRPGRFDAKYEVPYPDANARRQLIEKYMKGKEFAEPVDIEKLVKKFEGSCCAEIESTLNNMVLFK